MGTEPKLGVPVPNPAAFLRVLKPRKKRLATAAGPGDTFDLVGGTPHVQVWIGRTLPADARPLASAVLVAAEQDYMRLQFLFGQFATNPLVRLYIADLSGAYDGSGGAEHYGCEGTDLYVDYSANRPDRVSALFIAELSEVFQAGSGLGWDCGRSPGEGLSRFHAEWAYPGALDDFATAWKWLDSARANYIDSPAITDEDDLANGCSVLMLWWLVRLGWTAAEITRASGSTLAATYSSLQGSKEGWGFFSDDCARAWPPGKPSGVLTDNPWPAAAPAPPPNPDPPPDPVPTPPTDPTPTPAPPTKPPGKISAVLELPMDVPAGEYILIQQGESMKKLLGMGVALPIALNLVEWAAAMALKILASLPSTQPAAPTAPASSGS